MSSSLPEKTATAIHRRRHSFGEDELSYLPDRKREYLVDDDTGSTDSEFSSQRLGGVTNLDELVKEYKSNRKGGMLGWFKFKEQRQKLKDDISEKKHHIRLLEQRMIGSIEKAPHTISIPEMSECLSKLTIQLSEKTFELEIKAADNRILQEQLQMKMSENAEMEETILSLRQQLDSVVVKSCSSCQHHVNGEISEFKTCPEDLSDRSKAAEIESLKQEKLKLVEEKDGLDIQCIKLSEEASYAKELVSAAAAELRNLAEEVTKLSYQNAKLTGDLAVAKETYCRSCSSSDSKQSGTGSRPDIYLKKPVKSALYEEMQKELNARSQREASLQTSLFKRDQLVEELQRELNDMKKCEEELENELANMWVLVAKMKNSRDPLSHGVDPLTFPCSSYQR